MISDELKSLLIQVITSWQVIGATVALVLYFFLVTYIARFRRRLKDASKPKPKPKPKKKEKNAPPEEDEDAVPARA